jgi:hypothetical protein
VRDAYRREVQHCTEMEGEAAAAGMVSAGGVDQEDVRLHREGAHGGFQQRSLW